MCGHYEVVQFLIESGALCERDTFQGERCLYNALNDRIRNLLLSYDYSKSRDPLQPLAAHITSLLHKTSPDTSDITLETDRQSFRLHKFVLAARSPYFFKKLAAAPETSSWKVPTSIPARSLEVVIQALYFMETSLDLSGSEADQAILAGIDKLGRTLEIPNVLDAILETDRRLARQKRSDELERGQKQMREWIEANVLGHSLRVDSQQADDVKWDRQNGIFADVLLCAEDDEDEEAVPVDGANGTHLNPNVPATNGIPVGPSSIRDAESNVGKPRQATLIPAHRAMLVRSEYYLAMFTSPFKEAQETEYLPVVKIDCNPETLRTILTFIYTEEANFRLDVAIDVLFTADQLFLEKLKIKAATIISTLGNGGTSAVEADKPRGQTDDDEVLDVYDVIRAGWDTRVHRLEEFGARYIAYRLERYIDSNDFKEIVRESAARIQARQETDTVELIDDIRYYLSERFRMRFEDPSFDQLEEANTVIDQDEVKTNGQVYPQNGANDLSFDAQQSAVLPVDRNQDNHVVRTLDGEEVSDEFAQDAMNYQILLGKIDTLLENLDLDA